MNFFIQDWAGNILRAKGVSGWWIPLSFYSFDDAWDYIHENFKEDEHSEFFVVHIS